MLGGAETRATGSGVLALVRLCLGHLRLRLRPRLHLGLRMLLLHPCVAESATGGAAAVLRSVAGSCVNVVARVGGVVECTELAGAAVRRCRRRRVVSVASSPRAEACRGGVVCSAGRSSKDCERSGANRRADENWLRVRRESRADSNANQDNRKHHRRLVVRRGELCW